MLLESFTMKLVEAIRTRRSVKHFDPDYKLTEEEFYFLFSHSFLAPSSFNMQNWHVVIVDDKGEQEKLCKASWNQSQVKDCSATLIMAGNLKGFESVERFTRKAPLEVQEMFRGMVPGFYKANDSLQRDEAVRSVSLLSQNVMLVAKEMGLDTCPMIGFDPQEVCKIVQLPEDYIPVMMITLGRAKEPAKPRMGLFDLEEVVSRNTFGNNWLNGPIDDS